MQTAYKAIDNTLISPMSLAPHSIGISAAQILAVLAATPALDKKLKDWSFRRLNGAARVDSYDPPRGGAVFSRCAATDFPQEAADEVNAMLARAGWTAPRRAGGRPNKWTGHISTLFVMKNETRYFCQECGPGRDAGAHKMMFINIEFLEEVLRLFVAAVREGQTRPGSRVSPAELVRDLEAASAIALGLPFIDLGASR